MPASASVDAGALLSTGVAARRCGISRHTLLRAARRGDIVPTLRTPGGELRFRPTDVEAFAARLAHPEAPPPTTGAASAHLVEMSMDLMCMAGGDGYFRWTNPAFTQTLGWSAQALLSRPFLDFVHPDDQARTMAAAVPLAGGEVLAGFENRYRCADGSWRWISWTITPQPPEHLVYAVGRDVTERKAAQETHARLAAIVEACQDAIISKTLDGVITSWNHGAEHIYGYSAVEAIGQPITLLAPPDRLREMANLMERVGRGEHVEEYETERVRKDGRRVPVAVTMAPIHDALGVVVGAAVVARDISARKAIEVALRASEERYRQVEQHAPIGLALVAPDGRWLRVNPALCALVGYSEQELLARTFQDLTHPDDLDPDLDYVRGMIAGEITTYQMEKRYLRKDGALVWILLSVSLVRDAGGTPLYFISQLQDITERKGVEQALDTARRLADRRADAFATLVELGAAFAAAREPRALAQLAVAQLVGRFGYDLVSIYWSEGECLRLQAQHGYEDVLDTLPIHGPGVAARTVRLGTTQFVADTAADPDFLGAVPGIAAEICVPLKLAGEVAGILNVESRTADVLDHETQELCELVARQLAVALENTMLQASARDRARVAEELAGVRTEQAMHASAMATIGAALNSTLEPEPLYTLILEQAVRLLPSDHAEVLLYEQGWATVGATWGAPALQTGTRLYPIVGVDRPWLPTDFQGPVYLADTDDEPAWVAYPPFLGERRIRSILAAPLVIDGVAVGSLNLHSAVPGYYTEQQLPLAAAFAVQVCQALRNARLYQAEQGRRRAAEQLADLRTDFLGAVSHELRTPLTAIVGFAELLRERWQAMDETGREIYLERIVSSSNRQLRLVQDLLQTSRIEAGTLRCARVAFHVRPVVERAAAEVHANYRDQRIDLDGPDQVMIEGDQERVLQILINLIDNAAKYSPENSRIVVAWGRENGVVAVRVRDHGPGIPEASRDLLFTRFGRLPGSRTRAGRTGTGLGLYLSRLLAEAMHGDLTLDATGGEGSTFLLLLPASPS